MFRTVQDENLVKQHVSKEQFEDIESALEQIQEEREDADYLYGQKQIAEQKYEDQLSHIDTLIYNLENSVPEEIQDLITETIASLE